jgi:hypothetical protein
MPVLKLWHVTDPKLSKELLHHEDLKKREVRCYKIGMIHLVTHPPPRVINVII